MTDQHRSAREQFLLEDSLRLSPGGSQTRSKAPGRVGPPLDSPYAPGFPLYASGGKGAYLFGVDAEAGQNFLDCAGANAAIPLGYNDDRVTLAVKHVLHDGSLLSLPHQMECRVSQAFLDVCAPWAEQVRWVKTGSEALSAAVRLARIATGKSRVIVFKDSYHGWHDWTYARHQEPRQGGSSTVLKNGVPCLMAALIQEVDYGTTPSLGQDVAAIVFEPARFTPTNREWVSRMIDYARTSGVVTIFDELVYGLRWAKGGSIEYFGLRIMPDLACFGKALGNGIPVACVCGQRDLMAPAADYISGTYGGDALGLAAAGAVLATYRNENIIERLWDRGKQLWAGFASAAGSTHDAGMYLQGYPVHWRLVMPSSELLDETLQLAAKEHVLVSRASNNSSAAMTADEAWRAGTVLGQAAMQALTMKKAVAE